MIKKENIVITEKPDWVSWDDIHEVLMAAHAENREKGIVMSFPLLPGEAIKEKIGNEGKMLVALDNDKLVGTAALIHKQTSFWFGKHQFGYCCFDSVIPEYNGLGVYKQLCVEREKMVRKMGIELMLLDTHERNKRAILIDKKSGYKKISLKFYKDHYSVVMVKWLNECPYSDFQCNIHFLYRKCVVKLKVAIIRIKQTLSKMGK